jgi:hypothetical protein
MIVRALEELREIEQLTSAIAANLRAIDLDGRSLADLQEMAKASEGLVRSLIQVEELRSPRLRLVGSQVEGKKPARRA